MIEYHLAQEAKELFDDEIELDESYFGGIRKGSVVVVLVAKLLYSVF